MRLALWPTGIASVKAASLHVGARGAARDLLERRFNEFEEPIHQRDQSHGSGLGVAGKASRIAPDQGRAEGTGLQLFPRQTARWSDAGTEQCSVTGDNEQRPCAGGRAVSRHDVRIPPRDLPGAVGFLCQPIGVVAFDEGLGVLMHRRIRHDFNFVATPKQRPHVLR